MARLKDQTTRLKGLYRDQRRRKEATSVEKVRQIKHEIVRENLPYGKVLTAQDIVDYKDRMQEVITYANSRLEAALFKQEVPISLDRFLRGDTSKRFDISDINDPGELRSYMTMVRTILPDISENSDRGLIDTAFMSRAAYEGQFGNKWRETYKEDDGTVHYRHYNIHDVVDEQGQVIRKAINPELAKEAFAAYRRIEEEFAGYIGHQGAEGVYGSENLIIAIYDSYARGEDGQLFGHDLLNAWITQELGHLEGVNTTLDDAQAIITSWDDFISRRMF